MHPHYNHLSMLLIYVVSLRTLTGLASLVSNSQYFDRLSKTELTYIVRDLSKSNFPLMHVLIFKLYWYIRSEINDG